MQHQGTKKLETDRLLLRRMVTEDAEEMYHNWACEDAVTKFLTWPTHPNADVTKRVIGGWIDSYNSPDYYHWGMELKETHELIGNISVISIKENVLSADIGYCIGSRWWGRGLMPEAGRAVVKYLFEEVGLNRIAAYHDTNNPNSGRVMQKIGMTYEGTLRSACHNNQGIVDEKWYSILKAEYLAAQAG